MVLAERFATERLDALAHVENPTRGDRTRVLFVCSHNAGRSQLAAACSHTGPETTSSSPPPGTHPSGSVDPHVVQALTEAGIELDEVYPKPLTDEVVQAADIVITMGCGDACPVVPGHRYLDWPVPDPDGAPIAVVRSIRDAIDARITTLLDTLPST